MHGLKDVNFKISDAVLEKVIADYTRESGVRELDRQLASIMRNQAKELRDEREALKPTISQGDIRKNIGQVKVQQ